MARGPSRRGAKAEKARRLKEALDAIISEPPYQDGFDPLFVSRAALDRLPHLDPRATQEKNQARKVLQRFDTFVAELASYRERLDKVRDPDGIFDPGNPDAVGRLVVIALLAQDRVPLREIAPTYGSGVYAIYYQGPHPAYAEVSGTETPIYVGKADPDEPRAATPREQGVRLFGRLARHRDTIERVERWSEANGVAEDRILRVDHFECRRLVCATNAQLVAERLLIEVFHPAWNKETKICFGFSKHGDAAETRRNKKSPWHILHPGRAWAMTSPVRTGMTPASIETRLTEHFARFIPERDREAIMERLLDTFRQVGRAPAEVSEAAAETEEVAAAQADDIRRDRETPDLFDPE